MTKNYYVYVLEIEGSGEIFYVGKGTGARCKEHRFRAKDPKRQHYHIYCKINWLWKNGLDYRYRIIFNTTDEKLAYEKEKELIAIIGRENLTNLTDGGDGSFCTGHTEETKRKISEKNKGKKRSPETIAKMREVHTGKNFTEEQLANIKQKIWENPERLEHLRRQTMKDAKQVRRLDTGEVYKSIADGALSISVSARGLSQAIKENRPCRGIVFEFI